MQHSTSNLTPERRTDKNGDAVTRWIRAHSKKKKPAIIHPPASAEELNERRMLLPVNDMLITIATRSSTISKDAPHFFHKNIARIMDDGDITDPPDNLIKAVTLIIYIKGIQTENAWAVKDGDPETNSKSAFYNSIAADAAYISDHLDDIIELIPELTTRVTHDRHLIETLLNNPSRVLREGEL